MDLIRSWTESTSGVTGPVRLALYDVPRRSRHALMTRLGQASPGSARSSSWTTP
ncbi:hypothetical protein ACFQ0M_07500 [Kitasatospora aburaviensis]